MPRIKMMDACPVERHLPAAADEGSARVEG